MVLWWQMEYITLQASPSNHMISVSGHIHRANERKVCLRSMSGRWLGPACSSAYCWLVLTQQVESSLCMWCLVLFQSFGRSDTVIKLSFMSKEAPLIESPLPLVPACGSVYSSISFHSCSPCPRPPFYSSICCSCSHCLCSVSPPASLFSLYPSDSLSAANASINP